MGGIWRVVMLTVGGSLLIAERYGYVAFKYINSTWTTTTYIASIYLFPIASIILNYKIYEIKIPKFCGILELIGKASYNIYLVQMIYYVHFCNYIYQMDYFIDQNSSVQELALGLVLCVVSGIIFYAIENKFTIWMIRSIKINEQTVICIEEGINKIEKYI